MIHTSNTVKEKQTQRTQRKTLLSVGELSIQWIIYFNKQGGEQ